MGFPNKAGSHADVDDVLAAELTAAGIPVGKYECFRNQGEVKSSVRGQLYGWTFERAWSYWMCKGPGIELEAAERLHAAYGGVVRVDGHCGAPSPRERYQGLACGNYHVDTPEGLKALADTIKGLVEKAAVSTGKSQQEVFDDYCKCSELVQRMESWNPEGPGAFTGTVSERLARVLEQLIWRPKP